MTYEDGAYTGGVDYPAPVKYVSLDERIDRIIQPMVYEVAEVAVDRANENGGELDISGTLWDVAREQVKHLIDDVLDYVTPEREAPHADYGTDILHTIEGRNLAIAEMQTKRKELGL